MASIVVLALFVPATATPQSAPDQAAAEALFKQGRDLMAAGRLNEACPKFAESQRLDPAAGTLLNLAACYEKGGQIASAWVTYKEAASAARKAGQDDRARMARDKVGELEPNLPVLTIVVPPSSDEADLQIRRDGERVGRPVWGAPIPIDPGPHVVEASAPGKKSWHGKPFVATIGVRTAVDVPNLELLPPPPPDVRPIPFGASPETEPLRQEHRGAGQRAAGFIVGGVGVAGLVAGGVFGALALLDNNEAKSVCFGTICPSQGVSATENAKHAATASTIAFVAGGNLALLGVILYLTAPSEKHPGERGVGIAPMIFGPEAGGAIVVGDF